MKCYIREKSFIAKIAAGKLGVSSVAIVIGNTIYLHNTGTDEFIRNKRWLRHELVHIRQFQKHGYLPFIIKYLWESLKKGYYNNKFETAARAGENDGGLNEDIIIIR